MFDLTFTALVAALLFTSLVLYGRGWLRLRRRGAAVATLFRLLVFLFAGLLVGIAFLSPLNTLNAQYLFARMLQTVILCLLAAPAFFLSLGYDVMLWGLPDRGRRALVRTLQPETRLGRVLRRLTPVGVAWLLFLALFLIWHDATFANWALAHHALHTLFLILLAFAALMFWWHIVGAGPRLHRPFAPWLAALVLVICELVNMITGVSIAFAGEPLYSHYVVAAQARGQLQPQLLMADQALAGGLLWVAGSLLYVTSILLILNRLFERHGGSQPAAHPGWDDDDRMIMPGLEHRVKR